LPDKHGIYRQQVQLVVQVLPIVFKEACFALKGGTAINLFIRDLPRLSVDVDLVYLPAHGREEALANIRQALGRISDDLEQAIPGSPFIRRMRINPTHFAWLSIRAGCGSRSSFHLC